MTDQALIDSYDFSEDAAGLAEFIAQNMVALPDDEIVVYVEDEQGREARRARFERRRLTDGSTVVNLIIEFR